jgi:hypothetical protein
MRQFDLITGGTWIKAFLGRSKGAQGDPKLTPIGKLEQDFNAVPFMSRSILFLDPPMLFPNDPGSIIFRLRVD